MIRILFSLCALSLVFSNVNAQVPDRCGTMQNLEHHLSENPGLARDMDAGEARVQQWLANQGTESAAGGVLTIPVVVHVLYMDSTQNLSDAQVISQIDRLNADFRRMNADTASTRAVFDSIAVDMEIEFCLATTDPQGNPTTGINRVATQGGQLFGFFSVLDDAKSASSGGVDPWPTDKYLNIWVCNLIPIVLGYAQFPGDDPTTDGVVIGYNYFGTTGGVTPPYNMGRTTVHEVGHWLGLRHIWGDGDCSMDDFVGDTPKSDAANQGGCLLNENSCVDSIFDYPDMVENYMDYSDDACMNMFSQGQKDRAWAFLNTDRLGLFTSTGCSLAVSLDRPLAGGDLGVYPNPSSGRFDLRWMRADIQPDNFRVLDMNGREILRLDGKTTSWFDLSGYPSGIYLLETTAGDKRMIQKIVRQ